MHRFAVVVAVVAALFGAASPARAATGDATTDASAVHPTLSCTSRDDPAKGIDTTVFGYVNTSGERVTVPAGTWNALVGAPGVNPPTVFEPGSHPHAFEAHVPSGKHAHWYLGTGDVAGPGPQCKGRVSPAVAHSIMRSTLIWGIPLAFVWAVFWIKRRRDGVERKRSLRLRLPVRQD
jgi:hypothetical protein